MSKPANQPATYGTRVHYVHARRARKLRKRGEDVRPWGVDHGHSVFVWVKKRS